MDYVWVYMCFIYLGLGLSQTASSCDQIEYWKSCQQMWCSLGRRLASSWCGSWWEQSPCSPVGGGEHRPAWRRATPYSWAQRQTGRWWMETEEKHRKAQAEWLSTTVSVAFVFFNHHSNIIKIKNASSSKNVTHLAKLILCLPNLHRITSKLYFKLINFLE